MKKHAAGARIGLVSPYTGSNLGDAAIIEAARGIVLRHIPGAEFLAIVIDTERVSRLHGMEAFPLTSVPRSFYFSPSHGSEGSDVRSEGAEAERRANPRSLSGALMRKAVSGIPVVSSVARFLRSVFRTGMLELTHVLGLRRAVRDLDAIIVAGGGQFDDEYGGPWGHPYALLKLTCIARRAGVPVFFVGVGVCELSRRLTRLFLKRALSRAQHVSLRDKGSVDLLRAINVSSDLSLCPDLAFGLVGPGVRQRGLQDPRTLDGAVIGLSPIVFNRPGGWPTEDTAVFGRYWKEFVDLAGLLIRNNCRLRLFVTDDADFPLAEALHERLVTGGIAPEKVRLEPLSSLTEILEAISTCDAVVASRLHGVLLSHVEGVPVLAVSYHRKVTVHMIDVEQEKYCLDFTTFTSEESLDSLSRLLSDRSRIAQKLDLVRSERSSALEREFAAIAAGLAARGSLDPERGR